MAPIATTGGEERAIAVGMSVVEVPGDVATVVDLLTQALHARNVTLFATIDHASGARAAGLELHDEVLLVFGSPSVGTALMQADPQAGYDLSLRMLIWSQTGVTRVGYRDRGRCPTATRWATSGSPWASCAV